MGIENTIKRNLIETQKCEYKQFKFDICLYTLETSYISCPYVTTDGQCNYNDNVIINVKYNEERRYK